MVGCLERIFDLKKDPYESRNLIQGPKCAVRFDNFDATSLQKVVDKNSWRSYCSAEVSDIGKEESDEVTRCIAHHHQNILLRLHLMMSKLSVFVKYGNEPHKKFLHDIYYRKIDVNKDTNRDKIGLKEGENEVKGTRIEDFADYSNGTSSLRNAVMTCGVPIALELKGLEFEISPGEIFNI